ncbi:MAG: hypothetical protein E5V79_01930 [Mesorhizobium sp.]|uniref:DUF6882 domain-containing protein n=1 Tax=unclassified Mesorhizobium TaxID=325217 RepID=UPI000F763187|nr:MULTISPECIES: DUF6882 domain-containing protein [unclassified Mesorhizobium]AZO14541.1 hypothetical protein EJ069_07210 [Mesorhizobium sp. M2A.F.Ca.ET.043.05.1.1]RUX22414.1 hypothetical protein EOA23_23950 [Mesorhizobium sp. M2A.F.Ca.ET.042.01.1.1]RWE79195.1 MAG: hypothetical protein EOS42_02550 [Mesorhizobium sp.]TIV32256.1 MAG: hypothetical protein E5V90_03825 [Mesorhizobium sp.]TIV75073.1 MAG: hypothetical protein E5V79_01930 [Mesorhizobium sp.]
MQPDWYPAWRDEAFEQLTAKNARLAKDFRLGNWSRYDYDLTAGKLVFSDQSGVKVVSEIQIAGSTSAKAGNWLWAWANSNWPPEFITDAQSARSFGKKHGISELTRDYVTNEDLNALGWELTSVVTRICNACGAYRCPPDDGVGLYLILKTISWAS